MTELRSVAGETLQFEVGPVERDDPAFEIASSSGSTVTTVENHGYSTGDHVRIESHLWNPINGVWVITQTGAKTFTLDGGPSGSSGGRTGQAVRQIPVDLTLSTTEVYFTAKTSLALADASAFVQKTATLNSPSSARKNLATVTVAPADTLGLLDTTDFYFDVQLEEPDGRITRLDHGIWKVGAAVTRA